MSLEDKLYPLLALYDRFPDGLKKGIGFTYRQLPVSFRRGEQYGRFKNLVEAGEHWDAKQIEEYQLEQVRRTLEQANRHCPFYQKRFAEAGFKPERMQSLEDLKTAPLLEKIDLINHRDELAATNVPASARLYMKCACERAPLHDHGRKHRTTGWILPGEGSWTREGGSFPRSDVESRRVF
jgi:hypothetical protein